MPVAAPSFGDTMAKKKPPAEESPINPERGRLDLRAEPELLARVARQAARLGMKASPYIRQAIILKLEQDEASDPTLED